MCKTQKQIATDFLQQLLPTSEKSLTETFYLLKSTDISIIEFREFLYKSIGEEDHREINFYRKNITGLFYWFVIDKISKDYNFYFNDILIENIIVEDDLEFPMYKFNEKNVKNNHYLNFITLKLEQIFNLIENKQKNNTLNWFINQIFEDLNFVETKISSFY